MWQGSRCPDGFPVDCADVADAQRFGQREYCVKKVEQCTQRHELMDGGYRRKGRWSAKQEAEERRLATVAKQEARERRKEQARQAWRTARQGTATAASAARQAAAQGYATYAAALEREQAPSAERERAALQRAWTSAAPAARMRLMQRYLRTAFDVPAAGDRPDPAACLPAAPGTPLRLLPYQQAMIAPFAFVQELLLLSGTGTGKSLMYLEALAAVPAVAAYLRAGNFRGNPPDVRCYVIVKDAQQARNQHKELEKAPAWAGVRDRLGELVSIPGDSKKNRLLNFVKYTTAGNFCKDAGATPEDSGDKACTMDGQIVVMDECHVLWTLEGIRPNLRDKVRTLSQWLKRKSYAKLLALTGSFPLGEHFVPCCNQFLTATQLVEPPQPPRVGWCHVAPAGAYDESWEKKLQGMSLCMYSSDTDRAHFPVFETTTPLEKTFKVPGLDPTWRSTTAGCPVFAHARYGKIAQAYARALCDPARKPQYLKGKALVFVSCHNSAVIKAYDILKRRYPTRRIVRMLKSSEVDKDDHGALRALDEFNRADGDAICAANTMFATGFGFEAVRELHQLTPFETALDVQLAGRARRHCSHVVLPVSEWTIVHVVWEPKTESDEWTCEHEVAEVVRNEKAELLPKIIKLLWGVSFTRDCFRRRAPEGVDAGEGAIAAAAAWAKDAYERHVRPRGVAIHEALGEPLAADFAQTVM